MSKSHSASDLLSPKLIEELDQALGPIPLLRGEDAEAFRVLEAQIIATVQPTSALEYIYVRDVVILTWDIRRVRQSKISVIQSAQGTGMYQLLRAVYSDHDARQIANFWAAGDKQSTRKVVAILAKSQRSIAEANGIAFEIKLPQIECVERLLAQYESRRRKILKEVDHHRAALARGLRTCVKEIEADYQADEPASRPKITQRKTDER